ncbi:transporter substrate-binding domain-containing protein [Abyssalbus ytuae]|uniref:Transporter substrate-binding domain-containing protein n=1 Tax=Abyssalbus ytuae TaxID=2926907 RepID=A0A9E7D1B0_9FLAO|nr:transporter substrate-binding domain-containing protein [Abyssalbus ytuae]UOB19165.1 transporter substrate-binding domain-containing protein [Abyssalbus ytuae]
MVFRFTHIKILFVVLLLTACQVPKDPENSFSSAQKSGLKVGVVNNPPFVLVNNGSYTGPEIKLIKNFAKANKLNIQFYEGSESNLVKDLENYNLHIVAGGFEKNSLWKKRATLSKPYDKKHVLLLPRGENKLLFEIEKHILKN